ncbi:Nose resistant to fluoxetine protein 6 [Bulinus truncatus]|nr:Nose resistant to fluoxetine protein 6 [Bulinus truncatus]
MVVVVVVVVVVLKRLISPSDLLGKFNPVTFAATVMSESVTIFWPADYPASPCIGGPQSPVAPAVKSTTEYVQKTVLFSCIIGVITTCIIGVITTCIIGVITTFIIGVITTYIIGVITTCIIGAITTCIIGVITTCINGVITTCIIGVITTCIIGVITTCIIGVIATCIIGVITTCIIGVITTCIIDVITTCIIGVITTYVIDIYSCPDIDSVGKPPSGVMQGNTVMMGSYDQCVSIYVDDVMRGSFFRLMFEVHHTWVGMWQMGSSVRICQWPQIFWQQPCIGGPQSPVAPAVKSTTEYVQKTVLFSCIIGVITTCIIGVITNCIIGVITTCIIGVITTFIIGVITTCIIGVITTCIIGVITTYIIGVITTCIIGVITTFIIGVITTCINGVITTCIIGVITTCIIGVITTCIIGVITTCIIGVITTCIIGVITTCIIGVITTYVIDIYSCPDIDSVGKPPSGVMQGNTVMMGSYDQCVSIYVDDVMRGSFFRLMFKADFPSLQRPIAMGVQETGLPYLYWFICLPSGCSRDDASQIGTAFAKKSNVQLIDTLVLQAKDPTGDVCFIIAVVILSILGAFCLIGTVVDVYAKCYQKAADDQGNGQAQDVKHDSKPGNDGIVVTGIRVIHDDESGQFSSPTLGQQLLPRRISRLSNAGMSNEVGDTNIDAVDCDDNNTNSRMDNNSNQRERKTSKQKSKYIEFLKQFFLAFSVKSNLADILKAKHAPGDIKCLHGIRVVTISWVVIGHSYYMAPQFGNVLTLFEMTKWWSFQGIINAPFAVDTFFMLSGCLVSFLFLRSVQKTGKLTCKHMILYYVHRYLRLTPLYALVILFYTGIAPYLESGPFAKAVHDRDVACRSSWWWNILYISNFVEGADMCLNWSWYLANDMQFYVVAPLALVPIALGYLFPGVLVALLMFACHIISYVLIENKYEATIYINTPDFFTKLYIKPWTRVGPYAVGLILGIILFKRLKKQKLNKTVALIGWILAVGAGLTLVYATYDNFKDYGIAKAAWGHTSLTIYESVKSPVWAICVAWVVFACFSNSGGFINSFLSWQAWIPLSKLTFGAYLVHLIIMIYFNNNAKVLNYFSYHYVTERFISIFALSYGLSLIFSLLIETPVRNLIKPSANHKKGKQTNADSKGQEAPPASQDNEQEPAKLQTNQEEHQQSVADGHARLAGHRDSLDGKFPIRRMYLPQHTTKNNNMKMTSCLISQNVFKRFVFTHTFTHTHHRSVKFTFVEIFFSFNNIYY